MIQATADQATPSITPLGAVPFYRDGDGHMANTRVGISTFTIEHGINTENPPNPNKTDGADAAELIDGTRSITVTTQRYLKATLDTLALADAQAQNAFFAQYGGLTAMSLVQIVVPDFRFNYRAPDMGGGIVMEAGNLMIDAFDRAVCINFV